jgi:hypothetical protein
MQAEPDVTNVGRQLVQLEALQVLQLDAQATQVPLVDM